MGFLDKVKKKAHEAAGQMAVYQHANSPQAASDTVASHQEWPSAQGAAIHDTPTQPDGPCFQWGGETYPLPGGWDHLSMEEWFYHFESVRDRMMNIDQEQGLAALTDGYGVRLDPEEVLLITEYGFQSGGHWEVYRNWAVADWARQTGESPTDCEFRMGAIARDRIMAEKANAMSGAGGALAPVEGVSCELWAQIQAQIAGGAELASLIARAGIDQATWDGM